ncbi:hypothetical protein DVH24_037093 [Malus domestica]|uniref:Uncharacterized protein n=1 Tax=Malus domestica TaxID=3750 RepID=A0A498HE45_MALDO|nr:hypothetical protein DVH24_037093 [Malus domestica]
MGVALWSYGGRGQGFHRRTWILCPPISMSFLCPPVLCGHVYFLLPYSALRSDISPLDLASIARKLTSAAGSSPRLPLSLLRLILQARAANFAQALCGALRRRRGGEESGEVCGVGEFGYDGGLWLLEIVASFVEAARE